MDETTVTDADLMTLRDQLGRPLRGVRAVAARCATGHPAVVETEPRLPDGTPFPTVYYLTCPRAVAAASTLESLGVMYELSARLDEDAALADAYRAAHEAYLTDREKIGHVEEIAGVSAGGMPSRVKCLHVLAAHSLAAGSGVNPLGDEALERMAALEDKPWTPDTCTWRPA
ncbi:DUF501 domain-containing protein [Phytoactinopolyspora alkaliphila]|uniref:DUF501 domain-containing protein n=1 Tax=Phytoactinopolyspora alkaliphila TaxID=1783498 RepID=A0A6N9YJQ8_9ACTN|nr:DUF501 domain-containing protein [Phytoactinopolyspora alkaliphila]NED95192.1 DUF501 domain-containing protein [Phytoactinopolyspora alkaliphila]